MVRGNYYADLGVKRTASYSDIKKSHRNLSMQFHPDRPNGNANSFIRVNEAYNSLNTHEKRNEYNSYLDQEVNKYFNMLRNDVDKMIVQEVNSIAKQYGLRTREEKLILARQMQRKAHTKLMNQIYSMMQRV